MPRLNAGECADTGKLQYTQVNKNGQVAKTLLYLQEHGIKGREELNARADSVSEKLAAVNERIRAIDVQIKYSAEPRSQIAAYADYSAIRDKDQELLVHRHSVGMFLGEGKSSDTHHAHGGR